MEIKTLAEILAESAPDSAKSSVDNDKSNGHGKSNGQAGNKKYATKNRKKPRPSCKNVNHKELESSELTGEELAGNELENIQQVDNDLEDERLSLPLKRQYKKKAHKNSSKHQTTAQSDSQQPINAPSTSRNLPRRKKTKRFHAAAAYIPVDAQGNPLSLNELEPFGELSFSEMTFNKVSSSEASFNKTPFNPSISNFNNKLTSSILAALKPASALTTKNLIANEEGNAANTADATDPDISSLPSALQVYLLTPEQRHAKKEALKAESRLRWLAFYYLSRREYSQGELRQKLLDKDQDPIKVEALLKEFAEKGYQSEWRTALMLIREGLRKGRGRQRIKQEFYRRKLDIPTDIDDLIETAQQESQAFADFIEEDTLAESSESVDWLRLAVEARVKKYGSELPELPKEKARQLRFLQYRGFQSDICFEALKYNLETLIDKN